MPVPHRLTLPVGFVRCGVLQQSTPSRAKVCSQCDSLGLDTELLQKGFHFEKAGGRSLSTTVPREYPLDQSGQML